MTAPSVAIAITTAKNAIRRFRFAASVASTNGV
jgi:hypothetical protein